MLLKPSRHPARRAATTAEAAEAAAAEAADAERQHREAATRAKKSNINVSRTSSHFISRASSRASDDRKVEAGNDDASNERAVR